MPLESKASCTFLFAFFNTSGRDAFQLAERESLHRLPSIAFRGSPPLTVPVLLFSLLGLGASGEHAMFINEDASTYAHTE